MEKLASADAVSWHGRRPQPLPAGVLAGWLRAGFETGMLSDGPYPVRQRGGAGSWAGWGALGAALFLLTTLALSTWAIWWGGR